MVDQKVWARLVLKKIPNVNLKAKNNSLTGQVKRSSVKQKTKMTVYISCDSKRTVVEDADILPEKFLIKPLCVFNQSLSRH